MTSLPRYTKPVIDAYNAMNSQDSANDFFVAGLAADAMEMTLARQGRGGLSAVVSTLASEFQAGIAVAMFRVTAVDARGTTTSYRTKLVHVIFVGPKTPVMQRAKVASFNKALKEPFTANLALQTDNAEGDLTEAAIEKALRASGGAHQPTSFDFSNVSVGGGATGDAPSPRAYPAPASPAPASPAPAPAAPAPVAEPEPEPEASPSAASPDASADPDVDLSEISANHMSSLLSNDLDTLMRDYTDSSVLVHTRSVLNSPTSPETTTYTGLAEIRECFSRLLEVIKADKGESLLVTSEKHVGDSLITKSWEIPSQEIAFGSDTIVVLRGSIALHTVVTVRVPAGSFSTSSASASDERKQKVPKRPRIAVVPANSQTGVAAMRHLLAGPSSEYKVIGVVRTDEAALKLKEALPADAQYEIRVGADFSNPDTVRSALAGVERVVVVPPSTDDRADLVNAATTAAAEAGVKHVTLLSVLDAGLDKTRFAREFRDMERHVESLAPAVTFTFVRAAFFMENLLFQAGAIANAGALYGSHGDGKFAAVAVDDVGRLLAAVTVPSAGDEHVNKIYAATGPVNLSGADMAAALSDVLHRPVAYSDTPADDAVHGMITAGTPHWQAVGIVELHESIARGEYPGASDDVARVTGIQTKLEAWIREMTPALLGAGVSGGADEPA